MDRANRTFGACVRCSSWRHCCFARPCCRRLSFIMDSGSDITHTHTSNVYQRSHGMLSCAHIGCTADKASLLSRAEWTQHVLLEGCVVGIGAGALRALVMHLSLTQVERGRAHAPHLTPHLSPALSPSSPCPHPRISTSVGVARASAPAAAPMRASSANRFTVGRNAKRPMPKPPAEPGEQCAVCGYGCRAAVWVRVGCILYGSRAHALTHTSPLAPSRGEPCEAALCSAQQRERHR